MNNQRFFLGFAAGVASLLSVGIILAAMCNAPAAASETLPRPTSVSMDTLYSSSESAPPEMSAAHPNPAGQLLSTGSVVEEEEEEEEPAPTSQTGAEVDTPNDRPSSAESTAPEDPPPLPASPDEATAPLASYDASIRIPGSVLKPRESDVEWAVSSEGGCIYAISGDNSTIFNAPVYLPEGATVKYIRIYYNDQETDQDTTSWLTAYDLYGRLSQEWSVSSSSDGGLGYETSEELTHTINYGVHSYAINWRPNVTGDTMQICGFRIYYQSPPGSTYLPAVMRNSP